MIDWDWNTVETKVFDLKLELIEKGFEVEEVHTGYHVIVLHLTKDGKNCGTLTICEVQKPNPIEIGLDDVVTYINTPNFKRYRK